MSANPSSPNDLKLLPPPPQQQPSDPSRPAAPAGGATAISVSSSAPRQLADLPRDELHTLAEEFGLEPRRFKSPQDLVSAIHARRQFIASLDREALLDVVRWGRRPVPINATNEQLAHEILRIKSMRFDGLSERGLVTLARMRGVEVGNDDPVPMVVKKLKKKESFFTRLNRKRRAILGSIVSNMIGEDDKSAEYQFLPPADGAGSAGAAPASISTTTASAGARDRTIKEEIEESGLFGGIASRVKKTADQYINQKLDEIESRIDRKLDEIDRRLAEWRDKEIANRIRILKITLWASVIVAALSLVYSYLKVYFPGMFGTSAKDRTTINRVEPNR
ncbi:MAG TPA: hypothetical protein VH475_04675 [Tepidisphaeraceae bacterium]|jgi:hypothetical protein